MNNIIDDIKTKLKKCEPEKGECMFVFESSDDTHAYFKCVNHSEQIKKETQHRAYAYSMYGPYSRKELETVVW